ncbi:unnamed protein product [Sympodiomycopsis kandeliae]
MTLPCASTPRTLMLARLVRLAIFPLIAYTLVEFSVNKSITLGAPLRDFWFPVLAWSRLMTGIDICLTTLTDKSDHERAPRWIVPERQAHRFPNAKPLPLPAHLLKKADHGDDMPSKKTGKNTEEEEYFRVDLEWFAVPHTESMMSWRRFLWACDNIYLYRAGTSWFLPSEQRSLEWAHSSFVRAALHPEQSEYGRPESDQPFYPWAKLLVTVAMASQSQLLELKRPTTFYDLPLWHQLFICAFEGAVIVCTFDFVEYHVLPFWTSKRALPVTALQRLQHNPLWASGIIDFWGRRWHKLIRRKVCRVAQLLPFGQTQIGNKLGAFVVSGCMHSWLLTRFYPTPPTHLHAFIIAFLPGPLMFFASQGVFAFIEIATLGAPPGEGAVEPKVKALARRLLLWASLAWTSRWFAASLEAVGLHTVLSLRAMQPAGFADSIEACRKT